ncbi:efflux RND transporter periplasmic adaptor subunit [Psychromonas sp. psych-6C06]|uniref:efflux RND transporter periplasmic adaptor subunit n=1 Tax=Psychromonas sp. psych-6C06 TaxID=2058089 RepID=UPI000C325E22|nr:efflux RND transporter periplasmic adaptor subunit [Psychromonas sp. psych-6C06]PKF62559.1 efflux RND transporter periplasmic adaptor subunit [Psychromonas sp. psych-6C06]
MNKKQFILPFLILLASVAGYWGTLQLKHPPKEKAQVDNTPLVTVKVIENKSVDFSVGSYGIVKSEFETDLVAQVSGEVVYLSKKFVRGGFVKKGEVLAKIDASDYEAALIDARANVASAQAALVLEKAHADVAKEQWSKIKGTKPTALSLREPQVAQEKARLLSSQAGLKRANRNVERTIIRAPYDALVHRRSVSLGSYVSIGMALGQIFSTDIAEIRLPVPDSEMQYLQNHGDNAKVILQAFIAGENHQWSGVVVRNEGVIDAQSHMNYLVAQIEDPYQLNNKVAEKLRFGTYVTALISGVKMDNIAVIDRHLITNGQVAIADQQNRLQFQAINIARILDGKAYISESLKEGTQLITSALDYPIVGMPLLIKKQSNAKQAELVEYKAGE